MTILVDLDDTITDLLTPWLDTLNDKYRLSVCREDVKEWDMKKTFPLLTYDEIFEPLKDRALWRNVRPLPGAREYLEKLILRGHKIYIVTTSHYTTIEAKLEECLFRYFPFIGYEQVVITNDKSIIRGDILIDDNPDNLTSGMHWGILLDAPYNRGFDTYKYGVLRVKCWKEIYEAILSTEDFDEVLKENENAGGIIFES